VDILVVPKFQKGQLSMVAFRADGVGHIVRFACATSWDGTSFAKLVYKAIHNLMAI
jgi:hypothetical protein